MALSTGIQDLPPEILLKIFEHLKSPDVFKISEVCKSWCNVAQHQSIVNKTIVKLHSLENNRFLKSWRKFVFKLSINTHLPEKYFQFKDKFRDQIIEIEFDDIYLPRLEVLRQYLENLNNLKSLRFYDLRLKDYATYPDEVLSLNTVTSLFFSGNLLKDDVVAYILSVIPNLKEFTVDMDRSDYTKTISIYLQNHELSKSLRELKISNCQPDIFQSTHLDLNTFHYDSIGKRIAPVEALETFLTLQTNLKSLNLNVRPSFLTQVIRICSVNSIEELHFNCNLAKNMHNENFEPFWNLKYLKLEFADSALFKGLIKASEMQSLSLVSFCGDINETMVTDKFKFLTNLKIFVVLLDDIILQDTIYIKNCMIQAIFKNLTNLQELRLEDSESFGRPSEITDFGITGHPQGYPMARLSKLEKFTLISDTHRLTNESVKHIESMKSLRANQVKIRASRNAKSTNNPIFHKSPHCSLYSLHFL